MFRYLFRALTVKFGQHHQRLYTLDSQIQHLDRESLWGLGLWIARKWKHARTKREQAEKDVSWSMRSAEFLRDQWRAQVESQTKPLPRASLLLFHELLLIINVQDSPRGQPERRWRKLFDYERHEILWLTTSNSLRKL